jgi:hypothetical protein
VEDRVAPDRAEYEHEVYDRHGEGAERSLGGDVGAEDAHQARPVLAGGERQRHDRRREDHGGHGDHAREQRREQVSGILRPASVHPPSPHLVLGAVAYIHCKHSPGESGADRDHQRGQQP